MLGVALRGKKRHFSEEHKKKISKGKTGKGKGLSLKKDGYYEITMGENKGRKQHVVIMEKLLGRKIKKGECVHHIDGDKSNNNINNLAFMTVSAHGRLHRFEDNLAGVTYERDEKGRIKRRIKNG
jgi:hypothetical protein